jgi:mannitol 2-dehydrogenase
MADSLNGSSADARRSLSLATAAKYAGRVAVPKYERGSLRAGIFHFGVGNFHRSHQAV